MINNVGGMKKVYLQWSQGGEENMKMAVTEKNNTKDKMVRKKSALRHKGKIEREKKL
jgi:hypothetical protein